MASLLAELLHDVSRRASEIETEFARLKGELPPEVQNYRLKMEERAGKPNQYPNRSSPTQTFPIQLWR